MGIVVSIQQRLARLQAIATATKATAETTRDTAEIAFVTMAEAGTIDEVTATEHLQAFADWQSSIAYTKGQMRAFGEGENRKLYRCLQNHTSQDDWTPPAAVSLWVEAGNPAEEWPAWSQPVGAHDAYVSGAKVSHNDKHWTSTVDNNVWEPGVYGWNEASE